jgi:hypothetical protein
VKKKKKKRERKKKRKRNVRVTNFFTKMMWSLFIRDDQNN